MKVSNRSSILVPFALTLATLTLTAQTTSTPAIKATVPFSFIVAGRAMPAGEYTVNRGNSTVILRGPGDGAIALTNGLHGYQSGGAAKLVFHRYGSQFFLAEVWADGSEGRELLTSREERKLAQQSRPQRTIVAAVK